MQVLQRHHDACVGDAACVAQEPRFRDFQRLLLLTGKHTWGGPSEIAKAFFCRLSTPKFLATGR